MVVLIPACCAWHWGCGYNAMGLELAGCTVTGHQTHLRFTGEALLVARAHLERVCADRWACPVLDSESLAHHATCLGWETQASVRPQHPCSWLSSQPALGKVRAQAGTVDAGFDVRRVGVRCGRSD